MDLKILGIIFVLLFSFFITGAQAETKPIPLGVLEEGNKTPIHQQDNNSVENASQQSSNITASDNRSARNLTQDRPEEDSSSGMDWAFIFIISGVLVFVLVLVALGVKYLYDREQREE